MCRTFLYCRVSTNQQTTENQLLKVQSMGYDIPKNRVISESISGSVKAEKRPEFKNLIDNKLESGDRLIVLCLDRLGRDNRDVQNTVEALIKKEIKLISLDIGELDLTSPDGRFMLQVFASFAELERCKISERTKAGLQRAKKEGRIGGRPKSKHIEKIKALKAEGLKQTEVSKKIGIGIATVRRYWNKEA